VGSVPRQNCETKLMRHIGRIRDGHMATNYRLSPIGKKDTAFSSVKH